MRRPIVSVAKSPSFCAISIDSTSSSKRLWTSGSNGAFAARGPVIVNNALAAAAAGWSSAMLVAPDAGAINVAPTGMPVARDVVDRALGQRRQRRARDAGDAVPACRRRAGRDDCLLFLDDAAGPGKAQWPRQLHFLQHQRPRHGGGPLLPLRLQLDDEHREARPVVSEIALGARTSPATAVRPGEPPAVR